eukprot:456999-Prorocentrum_minimum.AAC.1
MVPGAGGATGKRKKGAKERPTFRPGVIHIGVLIPTTTMSTQLLAPDSLPLVNLFLPSFLSTLDRQTSKFRCEQGNMIT